MKKKALILICKLANAALPPSGQVEITWYCRTSWRNTTHCFAAH